MSRLVSVEYFCDAFVETAVALAVFCPLPPYGARCD